MLSKQSLLLREKQKVKRDLLFLKGPIPFEWINQNIPDASSRLILIAQAFMDMGNVNELPLSKRVWDSANISGKDARHRVLQKIANHVSGYAVIPRRGRITILRKTHPR